ncbi:MAG: hypothetical protein KatS3mg037_2090 [Ignavibacterium sp.]|nr:MAG: hypothetical protein KatS3mg037_2090 [Ignavibacterium sp.]
MICFLLGVLVGEFSGLFIISLLKINKPSEETREREQQ